MNLEDLGTSAWAKTEKNAIAGSSSFAESDLEAADWVLEARGVTDDEGLRLG